MKTETCAYCGDDILAGEPYDVEGSAVCETCYDEYTWENFFDCTLCDERQYNNEESDFFVLFDKQFGQPGLYRAIEFPFFSQPMIGRPTLWKSAVRRLGDVPKDATPEHGAPAAYVCKKCVTKHKLNEIVMEPVAEVVEPN